MKLLSICVIALCLCLHPGFVVAGEAQDTFVIGIWQVGEDLCDLPEMEAIFTEAYRRIGAAVPPIRDLVWANNLTIDACALRAKEALRDYPNHIINRKHANIIPQLSGAFTNMIQDGTLKRSAGRFTAYIPDGRP